MPRINRCGDGGAEIDVSKAEYEIARGMDNLKYFVD
jgi:hypothetical protein